MDDVIWRSLQGNTSEDEELGLAQWRAAAASNDQRYRELRALWEAFSLVEPRRATSRPSTAEILHAADGQEVNGWIRGAGRLVRGRRLATGVAAAAAIILALGTLQILRGPAVQAEEFVTGSGETASVRLADGSVVRLGPESRLRLPQGTRTRELWLDGKAFFAIAEQDGRSFTVQTLAGTATVLGTRFELQTHEQRLRLVVVEGRVAVDTRGDRVEVGAGEVSYVVDGAAPSVARVDDPRAMLAWMEGVLVFQDTPLWRVVDEIEAEYGTRIIVADTVLARRVVTAFFVDQPVEAVVSVVCRVVGARCSLSAESITMLLPDR